MGIRKVIVKMTFRKLFILNNVLHVGYIMKNLVYDIEQKQVQNGFQSKKFILLKSEIFVRKWYLYGGLLKMNVMSIVTKDNDDDDDDDCLLFLSI